ncbi:MAG: RNA methyltransferase [Balneolaceae bacterium]|nr:RNA methyltransferase [Balneolaceae bacterium]
MDKQTRSNLIEYLKEFTTGARWQKIESVVSQRTRHISVVVENIYQPHNASAVLRSCDGFGVQDVHIIEKDNQFDASSQVTIGADQWLNLHTYNRPGADNTEICLSDLKQKGYRIIATSPHENDFELNELPIDQKTALVFGTELDGISDKAKEMADGFMKIPMAGFSESLNISVSAAICLYNTTRRLKNSDIKWQLSQEEMQVLKLEWLKKSIKAGEHLEQKFLDKLVK